jgi:cell division protease FtsH
MADNVQPDPERSRRSRSFGSFLMILLVLVLVLTYVGNEGLSPPDVLTQDQYEWNLRRAKVLEQRLRGTDQATNLIEGRYLKDGKGETKFEVHFAALTDNEQEFRKLKGVLEYVPITARDFLVGLERGALVPVDAQLLVASEWIPALTDDDATERDAEERGRDDESSTGSDRSSEAAGSLRITHKLMVQVDAGSRRSFPPESRFGFELPEMPGTLHLDVELDPEKHLAALTEAIGSRGAKLERHFFDITSEEGGTQWEDSTSMLGWFLLYLGPWVLILIIIFFVMRQMRSQGGAGGVMSFGRSRAQRYSKESQTDVTFDDVAGTEEAKAEVREVVEFLKNPTRFSRIGGRIPRGILLVGPPGCGKTLLAKAIAGEAEVPFFSISGSDFVEMFVGVGASRVRDLFKQARESSPCIIFLDEIDAVGRRRGSGMGGGHDEREQTLNAILVEMDGFSTDEGIIVVAATNRQDVLDPALLRPGRFDREVMIDFPDLGGRRAILAVHLERVKSDPAVDLDVIAKSTPGYSGADLAAIINEAAIMAVLDKREKVSFDDLEEARDKVRYGRQKKSRTLEEEDRQITAYHEAGHAIVASILPEVDSPHKVTIVPRGRALGATMIVPDRESYHMLRHRLLGQIAMIFGGRAAEAIFCGDISAGAADDIRRATDLARAMVTELGMSEKIGPINYAERQGSEFLGTELMRGKLHSEETAREIDEEVRQILREAYDRSFEVVTDHRPETEAVVKALLEFETVTGEDVTAIREGRTLEELRARHEELSVEKNAARREAVSEEPPATEAGRRDELPGSPDLSPA